MILFLKIIAIFINYNHLRSHYNMAAKLWLHFEITRYLFTFPHALFVENQLCLFMKDEKEPMCSQRVFDEYEPAMDVTNRWMAIATEIKKKKLEERLTNLKNTLDAEEDFTTMTMLCFLKHNQEKYMIVP
jgi:hypothetical protein